MKYIFTTIVALCLTYTMCNSQEYKVNFPSGKINILGVDEIKIEGYNGSEVVLKGEEKYREEDDRSRGLKLINSKGLDDNTGMGISIQKDNGELVVQQLSNDYDCNSSNEMLTLMVPSSADIYIEHSTHNGDVIVVEGVSGEIETSVNYNDIYLREVTGPMAVKSVYGDIIVEFSDMSRNGSISIHSVYGLVDASVPSNIKADVSLRTPYGSVYSNLDIDVDSKSGRSSKDIIGTVNGGGVDFSLKASYDNVYLRTK